MQHHSDEITINTSRRAAGIHEMKTGSLACLTCAAFRRAIPEGKPGITAREAATVLEDVLTGETGILTAYAARVLTTHGWTELPNPYINDSPRYAPPGA